MQNWVQHVTLEGYGLKLEPLAPSHREGLEQAAAADELYRYPWTWIPAPNEIDEYLQRALDAQAQQQRFPWVVKLAANSQIIGTSSYHDLIPATHRLEIGHTWYAKAFHRTFVNSACKMLLLTHAFEKMSAQLVALRTDACNTQSQNAILRLGATLEGCLRHHALRRDGSVRDTMIYSISRSEWESGVMGLLLSSLQRKSTLA
jgi:N-acetyltransferase